MDNRLLHTPEGVRDIYGDEMLKKLVLSGKLKKVVNSFGYREIETPSFEYFDIFSGDVGTTPSKEIYKFFDSENNTLALRPDFTPGVARSAVKYFMDENLPFRLCYLGNTFNSRFSLQGKLKEVTELGVEYMGEPSVDADAEMVFLSHELLKAAGLKDFQICIGTAEYFRGITEATLLSQETVAELSYHIRNKNYFGTMDALNDVDIPADIRDTLLSFQDYFGGYEVLKEAAVRVADIPRSKEAVSRLITLYERLKIYGIESYVTFDLGMLSRHHYYTGILFRGYTFGTGDAIIRGGRYDDLLQKFGKPGAAIGFTLVIDQLLNTLRSQKIELPIEYKRAMVFYDTASFEEALKQAASFRKMGLETEMTLIPDTPAGLDMDLIKAHVNNNHAEKALIIKKGELRELEL